jgi:hypothetical protein
LLGEARHGDLMALPLSIRPLRFRLAAECQEENALKISSISSRNTSKIANAKME